MAENQGKKRYRDPYKLVLLKEETLEEVSSYRLTPINVYILVSSLLFVTSLIVLALVFFTPVRRLVPGYADVTQNREYMKLYTSVRDLETQVKEQALYIESFRKIAIGDSAALESIMAKRDAKVPGVVPIGPESLGAESSQSAIHFLYVVPPVTGSISRGYTAEHMAVDIVAPKNTAVKAILDGYVISSDWTLETGNTIAIQHEGNLVSFYKHNARNLKKMGAFVKAGEAVAIIGNTGELSSGPHLHFELWEQGHPVDPSLYVDFQ